jgi:hypothetical protein
MMHDYCGSIDPTHISTLRNQETQYDNNLINTSSQTDSFVENNLHKFHQHFPLFEDYQYWHFHPLMQSLPSLLLSMMNQTKILRIKKINN